MALHRRLPKRGFTNIFKKRWTEVSLEALERHFAENDQITPALLHARGIIKKAKHDIVVLGNGEIKKALKVSAHRFTKSARAKIEKAGGAATVIGGLFFPPPFGGGGETPLKKFFPPLANILILRVFARPLFFLLASCAAF